MSTPERMGSEFALVGFFTFVGEDPSAVIRDFEDLDRAELEALEQQIRKVFFKDDSVQVLLYPAIVPVDYAQEAIRDFHKILETGAEEEKS